MIRGIILYLISTVSVLLLEPLGLLFGFWKKDYLVTVAISKDQTANVIMSVFMNLTLIKKWGYKFGNEDQTISYVIGRNYLDNSLTTFGKFWRWFLDTIEKEHTLNAVKQEENGR